MSKYKDIINSYKEVNVSSTELYNGVMSLHNIFDYVEKQDNKIFWKSMRKLHESIKGAHFDEEYAKWQVSTMYHTADNGKICKGEIYNYDCAKNVFDKYVRNINSNITVWDVYVAINAQYHDYIRLYSEWFRNINKNELDNKIIDFILKMKILVVLKLGITLKQLIEFILDLLLRQYVFLNMLPLLLFIYLM